MITSIFDNKKVNICWKKDQIALDSAEKQKQILEKQLEEFALRQRTGTHDVDYTAVPAKLNTVLMPQQP